MLQFNVRDLLWRVLELSGILSFLSYFGFDQPLSYIALFYMAMVTISYWARFSRRLVFFQGLLYCGIALATLLVLFLSFILVYSMIFALVYAIVLALISTNDIWTVHMHAKRSHCDELLKQRSQRRSATVVAMLLATIVCFLVPNPVLIEIQRNRIRFPVRELTINDRGTEKLSRSEISRQAAGLSPDVDRSRATNDETSAEILMQPIRDPFLGYWSRNHEFPTVDSRIHDYRQSQRFNLEDVHQREHEAFVRRIGFGVTRMSDFLDGELVEFPEFRPIELASERERRQANPNWLNDGDESWHLPGEVIREMHQAAEESTDQFHRINLLEFVDPRGWGWAESFRKVAGFSAHGLRHPPMETVHQQEKLVLRSLQLISLERFDEPRVYQVETVPQMVELSSSTVPTRSLNEFERRALDLLMEQTLGANDLEVVIEERGQEILMLGAVPAAVSCFDCHASSTRGLLGAFTYVFEKE